MLQGQPCQADNLAQLGRLFDLWWGTGDSDAALRVLDDQQAALLPTLPESERLSTEVELLFWRPVL